MQKWEYMQIGLCVKSSLIEELDKLGQKGWELVAIQSPIYMILKRSISEEDTEPNYGSCSICDGDQIIITNGVLAPHLIGNQVRDTDNLLCEGSGKPPCNK